VAVVDTHTGRVLGGSMTGWESAIALDTRRGRAYLSNSPGLQVLDIRSGQPLPNLPLGLPNIEDDLALDAGTDHLYIATRSRDEQIEVVRVRLPAGHPTQIVRLGPYPPATGQPTLLTLDAPRKRLYLSVGLRILVLDAATCRQIAAIPLPFASSILALDPSTGYLLVAGEDPPGRRWQSSWPGWLASLPFAPPGPAPNPHHALILDPVRLPALRAAH